MKTLLIYTKQGCNGCLEAKNFLDDLNIPYTEVDVESDQHSADFLIQQGDKFLPQFYSNGKKFIPITVSEEMIGHKLGEFSPTRQFNGHTASDKKAVPAKKTDKK